MKNPSIYISILTIAHSSMFTLHRATDMITAADTDMGPGHCCGMFRVNCGLLCSVFFIINICTYIYCKLVKVNMNRNGISKKINSGTYLKNSFAWCSVQIAETKIQFSNGENTSQYIRVRHIPLHDQTLLTATQTCPVNKTFKVVSYHK